MTLHIHIICCVHNARYSRHCRCWDNAGLYFGEGQFNGSERRVSSVTLSPTIKLIEQYKKGSPRHHKELKAAADNGELTASLSQVSFLVEKMDDFFLSKCKIEFLSKKEYERYYYSSEEKKKWKNNLYNKCLALFKFDDLQQEMFKVSTQNDQNRSQQEDTKKREKTKAKQLSCETGSFEQFKAETIQLMGSLFNKMLQKLPKNKQEEKANSIAENGIKILTEEQNMLMLHQLFKTSSKNIETMLNQLSDKGTETNRWETFMEDGSLIKVEYYEELMWKFMKISEIIAKHSSFKTKIMNLKSWYLNSAADLNVKWIDAKETISAWKLNGPLANDIQFVNSLNTYKYWQNFLENGPDDLFTNFQTEIKAWKIVGTPSGISKIKKESNEKISYFIEHFRLIFKQKCERNRLFLLTIVRISMDFVQNAKNEYILEEDVAKKMLRQCGTIQPFSVKGPEFGKHQKKMPYSETENVQKDLDYFKENIYDFYYEKETGDQLKEIIKSYKNEEHKKQLLDEYVSLKQLGEDEKKMGKYVLTKVLHAFGDILRQGESLALLEWLITTHKEISMVELTYLIEKLTLFFDKVNSTNALDMIDYGTNEVNLSKLERMLNGMTYEQLMEWFKNDAAYFDNKSKELFDNLLNFFDFAANCFVGISEYERKLVFCYELLRATTVLLKKALDNRRMGFLHQTYYKATHHKLMRITSIMDSKIRQNSSIEIYPHIQIQTDFKFENAISSTFKMFVEIPLKNVVKMLETIDFGITKKCVSRFWHLKDTEKMKEIANCANQLDFDEMFKNLKTEKSEFANPPIILFNLLVNVLHCQHQTSVKGAKIWVCPFYKHILPQISADGKMKFAILKGLLQFGRDFKKNFDKKNIPGKNEMQWNNIKIVYDSYYDEFTAFKNSFTSGLFHQMFNSNANAMPQMTVYISMKNIWQLLETINAFILSNCEKKLWHLADKEESKEMQDCSNKLDLSKLWTIVEENKYNDQLTLLNMIAHVSNSKAKNGAEIRTSAFHQHILPKVSADSEMAFDILKGLLKFGLWFKTIYDTWIVESDRYQEMTPTNQWNNISIEFSKNYTDDWETIKKSLKSGKLKQMFESSGDAVAEKTVVFFVNMLWQWQYSHR